MLRKIVYGGVFLETNGVINQIINIISSLGYVGISLIVAIEYGCFPMPSEILLPFIGFICYKGVLKYTGTLIASIIGGILGTLFCYTLGYIGGESILNRIKIKYPNSRKSIEASENWFSKYGKLSVLLSRVFPIARTYIAIPAGIAKMDVITFVLYSSLGITLWNTLLITIGYYLGNSWSKLSSILGGYSKIFKLLLAVVIVFIIAKKLLKKRNK